MNQIETSLQKLYPEQWAQTQADIMALMEKWKAEPFPSYSWINEADVMMIAYGDSFQKEGEAPLRVMKDFLDRELSQTVNLVHLLPIHPYSSDDGFSVIDFRQVNPAYGAWEDVARLQNGYGLMLDAVLNHVSQESAYFQGYLRGDPRYQNFFIEADPKADYCLVVRPRILPLLTRFETGKGTRYLWTTFSDDQIDLNYQAPEVLLEMLDVLLFYARRGARFIRFDAVGFAWKELGTPCIHHPKVHELIKLMRAVVQSFAPGCTIITETNVPHAENISYFGNGHDEAGLVYQFPLPPLTLFSFLTGNAQRLTEWADGLEPTTPDTTYFNFLASHDGIGMRPVEGILSAEEQALMAEETLRRGGEVSCRTLEDGSEAVYELNINYLDAITANEEDVMVKAQKFMASQSILLAMVGLPAIYYHSMVGSRGNHATYVASGIKRHINRERLQADALRQEMHTPGTLRYLVVEKYRQIISLRKSLPSLRPNSPQRVLRLAPEVFALLRGGEKEQVLILVNVSGKEVWVTTPLSGKDLVSGEDCGTSVPLAPWQYRWIR